MAVIVKDTFTDTNGTLLTNHVPDISPGGRKWTWYRNPYHTNDTYDTINASGQLNHTYTDAGTTDGGACIDSGISDGVVSVTLVSGSGSPNPHVSVRINPTDGSRFYIENGSFFSFNGSAYVNMGSVPTPANGSTIKITLNGSNISVQVDANTAVNFTSTMNQSQTYHGLGSGSGTVVWDNFEIDSAGGASTSITATSKSSSTQTAILLDSRRLSGTFKSNSSANAAVLLDQRAESTTVSSTSSQHDGMTVTRLMGSTVKGNSTSPAANLTVQSGIWVSVVSNGKSNSSSSLVSQVSRLMVSTVKTQSSVTGGLKRNANMQSTVISTTGTSNQVKITTPVTKLVSRNRSNSFAKVTSTVTTTNPKVTTRSFTKATGYLLNLQVVSQLIETIKFKRGNKASLPALNVGEPAFTLDTDEMFVGSSTGNIKILGMIVETSVANLPSPSVTNHWQICGVLGDGSTTADALYICKQLANGTYDWVQFA